MDTLTPERRSRHMAAIRQRGTRPEMILRRALHAAGLRYRLHVRGLPGTPDIAFPGKRLAVFVHGCFWHGHGCRGRGQRPSTRTEYWDAKLAANVARDQRKIDELAAMGWRAVVVWECETRAVAAAVERIRVSLTE